MFTTALFFLKYISNNTTGSNTWFLRQKKIMSSEKGPKDIYAQEYKLHCSWNSIDRFQSRGQQLCKLRGIKGSFNMWKEFNSHRIFFVHTHGRRFIVLYINMATVMSCENDLLKGKPRDQGECHLNRGVPWMEIGLGFVLVKSRLQHAPPPGHTPGIWHLCHPGEDGIWLSEFSRGVGNLNCTLDFM